jgi:hypothetical protein
VRWPGGQDVMSDHEEAKRLTRNNPWGTFASATSNGLVACQCGGGDGCSSDRSGTLTIISGLLLER